MTNKEDAEAAGQKWGGEIIFLAAEAIVMILYITCTEYGEDSLSTLTDEAAHSTATAGVVDSLQTLYPMYQDIHVMIFIGFGFLMVFLKTHSWTSVGYNYLIACWCIQITILIQNFMHMTIGDTEMGTIQLNVGSLISGDFGAGTVLITFGALLGKCSWPQLWVIGTLEIIFYSINEAIGVANLKAVDIGGSMFIHTFGAYFGLAAAFFFQPKKGIEDSRGRGDGSYNSQLIAMVGTVFLFMFWPSFNGALAVGDQQQRVEVNTVISISASTLVSVYLSRLLLGRIDMEVMLNSTLAGGVAVGSAADLVGDAGISILLGGFAGAVSALGFMKLNAICQEKLGLHDTCGVQFLHGIPGVIGGIAGAILTSCAGDFYSSDLVLSSIFGEYPSRSLGSQAGYQMLALIITLIISISSGALTGFIASKVAPFPVHQFDDKCHFEGAEYEELGSAAEMQPLKSVAVNISSNDEAKAAPIKAPKVAEAPEAEPLKKEEPAAAAGEAPAPAAIAH